MNDIVFNFERVASHGVAWTLLLLSLLGMFAFFPRKHERGSTAEAWLLLAIWLGFVGVGLNVLYWRVFGDLAVYFHWMTVTEVRAFGNTWGDVIWKGASAVSVYLHFYSRWKFLTDKEREGWRPLLMGWYPDGEHWVVRTVTYRTRRRNRLNSSENNND